MTREIKFRAWVTMGTTGKMHEGVGFLNGLVLDKKGDVINKAILMQYTSLKDKNGVEIYEGDVVKLDKKGWCGLMRVEWDEEKAGFRFTSLKKAMRPNEKSIVGYEIIGNIHESPDLLATDKE